MDNKNIIIIVLVGVLIALSVGIIYSNLFLNQNQNNQPVNSTNNTTTSVNVEKITPEDEKSNSASSSGNNGIHRVHLIGGDVAVNGNGIVVGHFKSNGEYIEGGQLAGMTIEEARAFDERASKYGLT